jgi:gliding motility-associated-like protein
MVTVNATPTISALASPSTICSGGSSDLTGSGATTYSWNPGGLSGTTVTVSPTTTTTYTVTGTSGSCTGTSTVTVTVSSSLAVSAIAAPPAICSGSATTLTGSGATTYSWNPGGLSGTSVTISPTTTTTYSVTGTSGGCSGTGTVVVTVNPLPNVTTSSTSTTCNLINGSATVTPSGGTSPYTYSWNTTPSQTSATANNIPSGNYIVTVTDANGCSKTAGVFVPSTGGPTASITPTSALVILGDSIALTATGGLTYQWTPSAGLSCTNCPNPVATPTSNTVYCVIVADSNLCTDTACVIIQVDFLCGEVFVPNAFSPNDDGKNDVFYVRGTCITTMTFAIYDRWGEKVFESEDPLIGWDGLLHNKPCNTGVFVWYLQATLHDGTEVSKKGNLSLFR